MMENRRCGLGSETVKVAIAHIRIKGRIQQSVMVDIVRTRTKA